MVRLGLLAWLAGLVLLAGATTTDASAQQESSASAPARFLPPIEEVIGDADPTLLGQLFEPTPADDGKMLLARFDTLLVRHDQPSKLRGLIQFFRSSLLVQLDREGDAKVAADESIRLLPDYSGPLIQAASMHTYWGRPDQGAAYLQRAIAIDPATVAQYPDYELMGLITRLETARQYDRARQLADQMLTIGWSGTTLDGASKLALRAISLNLANGNVERARSLVSRIVVPAHAQSLLVDKEYEAVWPTMEQWAGMRLEKLWRAYLTETRSRFKASADDTTMTDLSKALETAERPEELIKTFEPLFAEAKLKKENDELVFVITDLSQAMVRLGRAADADALFARARTVWPLDLHANSLNVHANWGTHLLHTGRAADALRAYDAALAAARKFGPQVNENAVQLIRGYRACALYELGQTQEALSVAEMLQAQRAKAAFDTFICIDRPDRARKILLGWLPLEDRREAVLNFLQPASTDRSVTEYRDRLRARYDALRGDQELRAAIAPYGRILPYSLGDGATGIP